MSRRGMHPSLMVCNSPKLQHPRPEKAPNEITGLESPQRRRFLREQRNDQAASAQSRGPHFSVHGSAMVQGFAMVD